MITAQALPDDLTTIIYQGILIIIFVVCKLDYVLAVIKKYLIVCAVMAYPHHLTMVIYPGATTTLIVVCKLDYVRAVI